MLGGASDSGGPMGGGGGGGGGDGVEAHESGGCSSEIGGVPAEEIGGGGGGNRWPREETLALLKIRSEMDVAFRDSSLKGPLWEEVSRKMATLGFHRSAKKCKEKFENVYKYHKRTKDGRAAKSDGKTYRFFDQMEAFKNSPTAAHATVASISPTPLSVVHPQSGNPMTIPFQQSHPQFVHQALPGSIPAFPWSPENSTPSSSSTSSDENIQRRRGRKRKWKYYFEKLMKEVGQKQEALQKKFLETLERRERERAAREEAWRAQETARMNREHENLVRERSAAAAKDAALIAFLQKATNQQTGPGNPQIRPNPPTPPIEPEPPKNPPAAASKVDNGVETPAAAGNSLPSPSRWPKVEIEALIDLRTSLDLKYQENGPKGPLWEDISAAMAKLGYSRSAKRCKEKWENINKYYKKVKESNKRRLEDSKTCPYFHQLEAVYKERAKTTDCPIKPDHLVAQPTLQWRPPEGPEDHQNLDNNHDEDEFDEDDDECGEFEMIANKQPSAMAAAD